MEKQRITICLRDTDATGVLYFAEQFRMAQEALEKFLKESGFPLGEILQTEDFLLPIVHAEGDYFSPLKVGDEIEIFLKVSHVGTSSFRLDFEFSERGSQKQVGKVSLVHVCVSKETRKAIPIPEKLLNVLTCADPV